MSASFSRFSHLPTELRLKIWDLALLPPPQLKLLTISRLCYTVDLASYDGWTYVFTPRCAIPTILHVCHESRELGLEYYNAVMSGEEVTDRNALVTATDFGHRRSSYHYFPALQSRERIPVYWASKKDLILLYYPWETLKAEKLQGFLITQSRTWRLEGIKYVAMEWATWRSWSNASMADELILQKVDVLFILMDMVQIPWCEGGAFEQWFESLGSDGPLALEGSTVSKWGIKTIEVVKDIDAAMAMINTRRV
ncbi:uncharacterized protein LY89DRAFT_672890 [Mollisia scopiformis]|uniref:2EXR domain-containing protein n=1 Tax=Mollisia scopiformis TaxID=149040 RepID=A0A194WXP6_MOLSC|nr:uncharacterized protein LY89DRAFT_672890 [Mollisia scopiformis]KUJ12756.1 hypothetical protein LY89DRAFT_672890 [Mollisia scopiformis]